MRVRNPGHLNSTLNRKQNAGISSHGRFSTGIWKSRGHLFDAHKSKVYPCFDGFGRKHAVSDESTRSDEPRRDTRWACNHQRQPPSAARLPRRPWPPRRLSRRATRAARCKRSDAKRIASRRERVVLGGPVGRDGATRPDFGCLGRGAASEIVHRHPGCLPSRGFGRGGPGRR